MEDHNNETNKKNSKFFNSQKDKTDKFFKTTKVGSCSHIIVRNGVSIAVPFSVKNEKGNTLLAFKTNETRSSEVKSVYRKDYDIRPYMHAGMSNKPLHPYNPTSYRNRLPTASVIMPHKNKSIVELGDRG